MAGLDDVVDDHQHAAGGDRRLGIVGLLEAAAGDRHDARLLIGQVDLVLWIGPRRRRLRRLAARLAAGFLGLLRARLQLRFMLGLRASVALLRPRLDLRLGLGNALQTIFAPGQLFRHRHAIRHVRLVRRLRQRHHNVTY